MFVGTEVDIEAELALSDDLKQKHSTIKKNTAIRGKQVLIVDKSEPDAQAGSSGHAAGEWATSTSSSLMPSFFAFFFLKNITLPAACA